MEMPVGPILPRAGLLEKLSEDPSVTGARIQVYT